MEAKRALTWAELDLLQARAVELWGKSKEETSWARVVELWGKNKEETLQARAVESQDENEEEMLRWSGWARLSK